MRTYLIITSLVIFLLTAFFLVAVLLRRRPNRQNLTFGAFAASVLFWSGSHFSWQLAEDPESAMFWCRMLVWGSIFIPVTYLHFVSELTGYPVRRVLMFGYGLALAVSIANAGGAVVRSVEPAMQFEYWPMAGPFFPLYLGTFVFYVFYSFYLLVHKFRESPPNVRNQLQYLIIGTALGFAGGSTNFFLWVGIPVPPYGNGLGILYILGTGYSAIRYRLLEFNEGALRIAAVFASALLLSWVFAQVSFPAIATAEDEATSFFRYWAVVGALTLVLFFLIPLSSRAFDHALQTVFSFRSQFQREQLRTLGNRLTEHEEESSLFDELVRQLTILLPVIRATVYYRGDFELRFERKAYVGPDSAFPPQLDPLQIHALATRLLATRGSVLYEELEEEQDTAPPEDSPPSTPLNGFLQSGDLITPIISERVLDGFLVLGVRQDRRIFTEQDISLLETVCSQIGLALRSRQIERRSNQVDKLISLGTLAAGLAHELRNPMVSIKTFATLMQDRAKQEGEHVAFADIVQRDINRITSIIENVAAFAENSHSAFASLDLNEVITRTYQIERHRIQQQEVEFSFKPISLPSFHGNFHQLMQVFLNIFQNAIQAMENSPVRKLQVVPRVINRRQDRQWIEITVCDTGVGISPELLPRIFDPFTSTKNTGPREAQGGSGLGLAIAKRIVEAHRGLIQVESNAERGTRFRVSLPSRRSQNNR